MHTIQIYITRDGPFIGLKKVINGEPKASIYHLFYVVKWSARVIYVCLVCIGGSIFVLFDIY